MTVGLTGVIFAWLLQIIGEKECGVNIDELFEREFTFYRSQILFFLIATIACIYFSSDHSDYKTTLAVLAFVAMICGMANMWIMCTCFLFSTAKRRTIAFCFLEGKLKENWNIAHLECWAGELRTCLDRGEDVHIDALFESILWHVRQAGSARYKAKECTRCMELLWERLGAEQWHRLLHNLLKKMDSNDGKLLLTAYLIQAARLSSTGNDRRYKAVLTCIGQGTAECAPGYLLALYLAFCMVHRREGERIPEDIYTQLTQMKWTELGLDGADLNTLFEHIIECYGWALLRSADEIDRLHSRKYELKRKWQLYANAFPEIKLRREGRNG